MNRVKPSMWIAAGVLVLAGWVSLQGQNTSGPRPVTVAVVDVQEVFKNMAEKTTVEADITRRGEQMQKQTQDKAQEIKALEADLSILGPDSNAYKETEAKAQEKTIALRVWRELEEQKLEREKAVQMERLYLKVAEAASRLAKKNGYDLVLYKDQTESAKGRNQQQVATIINMRKVIYSAPDMDVTSQITQMLNNEFNNKK